MSFITDVSGNSLLYCKKVHFIHEDFTRGTGNCCNYLHVKEL